MLRLATAVVLLPVLWVVVKMARFEVFFVFAVLTIAKSCWECYEMIEARGGRPFKLLGLVGALALVWSFSGEWPTFGAALPLAATGTLAAVLAMARRHEPGPMLETIVHTTFPVAFVGLLLAFLVGLRVTTAGPDLLMFLFACVVAADTAAYYVGTAFGRRRLAPTISPKKSWEGALGGLLAGVAGALIARAWFFSELPLLHAVLLGVLLSLAAVGGDLTASVIKRASGVKDFSGLLPGHGGMLDRMDSLLFSAPLLYYYHLAFLQGLR